MNRRQKKCRFRWSCFHAFLALALVVGSAFFVNKERPQVMAKIRILPTTLLEGTDAGGGGNPKIAQSDDQQKGDTVQPVQPKPVPPPQPQPKPVVQTPVQ